MVVQAQAGQARKRTPAMKTAKVNLITWINFPAPIITPRLVRGSDPPFIKEPVSFSGIMPFSSTLYENLKAKDRILPDGLCAGFRF
jgi:hypothetical protein